MLGKNLISSVLTQIPVFILGVVSGVFSTRILGEEAKGAFAIFQANTQLFTLVFSLGIQTGIVYFISSKKITENRVAGMSICIFSFASILLLIIIFLGSSYNFTEVFLVKEFTSNLYLIVLYLLFLMTFFISIISSFFQAHSKFRIINFISIVNSVINAALFLFLFIYFQSKNLTANERFDYVLYGTLASLFINSSLWLYFQIKELKITPDFKFKFKNQFIPFISYNMVIYLGTFINFFNYRLDLWIVNQYLDKKNLSYYSLATNINQIILYVSVTIGTVMLPNLAKKNTEERIKTFSQISRFSFTFFIVLTVF
ncbi:MAG: oligosaccharide flippase family protein, partial [Bacteroidia bacterium]|nr:oligosaccharide flippase family protein [Bacteroidia bacterium]